MAMETAKEYTRMCVLSLHFIHSQGEQTQKQALFAFQTPHHSRPWQHHNVAMCQRQ